MLIEIEQIQLLSKSHFLKFDQESNDQSKENDELTDYSSFVSKFTNASPILISFEYS